jgi:hypothetical protein
MVIKKRKARVPHFEFTTLPVEVSLDEKNLNLIKMDFNVLEKGIYFEGGCQIYSVLVLSKKEELKNDIQNDN